MQQLARRVAFLVRRTRRVPAIPPALPLPPPPPPARTDDAYLIARYFVPRRAYAGMV